MTSTFRVGDQLIHCNIQDDPPHAYQIVHPPEADSQAGAAAKLLASGMATSKEEALRKVEMWAQDARAKALEKALGS
jgi:hypothetical protein